MSGSSNARSADWPTSPHSTKKLSCSILRKLFSPTSQQPQRAMRPILDTASFSENFNVKQEESSRHLRRQPLVVIRGRQVLPVHIPTRVLRPNNRCRWDLTGIWAVWTSRWTQICGCSWIRSRSVSTIRDEGSWREEDANKRVANNQFHQDNYSFSTSPNMGANL